MEGKLQIVMVRRKLCETAILVWRKGCHNVIMVMGKE
jgi:hypothetical protein